MILVRLEHQVLGLGLALLGEHLVNRALLGRRPARGGADERRAAGARAPLRRRPRAQRRPESRLPPHVVQRHRAPRHGHAGGSLSGRRHHHAV